MSVVELFAGPGGMSEAIAMAGVPKEETVGFEIDRVACETAISAGHRRVMDDLLFVDPHDYIGAVGKHSSPPCQGLSITGSGKGREDIENVIAFILAHKDDPSGVTMERLTALDNYSSDERSVLTALPLYWVSVVRPEWVTLEQVPTALPIWQAYATVLREWGYSVWTGIVNAEQYGVPQTRRRAFLRASRVRRVGPPTPTHSKYHSRAPERMDDGVLPWVGMVDVLDVPYDDVQRSNYSAGGAAGATASERGRSIRPSFAPSLTITSKGFQWQRPDGSTYRPSIADLGTLQSFRADYPWAGTRKQERAQQVGNAVPPLLGLGMLNGVVGTNWTEV